MKLIRFIRKNFQLLFQTSPIQEPHQLNKSPVVSRKKRFITDIIGLGIQAFGAISQHKKQSKLQKSMKQLKHRQDVLYHKIEALEDDMISKLKKHLRNWIT